MNIDLTPIFQAIIALLAALVTYKLIPWIRSKTTKQQQDNLETAARIAVFAAEQLWGAAKETNEEKLHYALEWLENAGFTMDTDILRAAIEKAVYQLRPAARMAAFMEAIEDEPVEAPEEDAPGIVNAPPDAGE